MSDRGTLTRSGEALAFIECIGDPVTRNLVNMAFVHLVQKAHLGKREAPQSDLDLLYLVQALAEFFAEHEVIGRALQGEAVGVWSEATTPQPVSK
jgi:hypothetical protein